MMCCPAGVMAPAVTAKPVPAAPRLIAAVATARNLRPICFVSLSRTVGQQQISPGRGDVAYGSRNCVGASAGGEAEPDAGARARVGEPDAAAVRLHDRARNRQPQTSGPVAASRAPGPLDEGREDAVAVAGVNAPAG